MSKPWLDSKETQEAIYAKTCARGYCDGWTPYQFAVRQIPKLLEEVAELAAHTNSLTVNLNHSVKSVAKYARDDFDDEDSWRHFWSIDFDRTDLDSVLDEAADVMVVLCNMVEAIGQHYGRDYDLLEMALSKATKDVERGKRANNQPEISS